MSAGGRAARVAAQGKINLALRVLARETTGYHQLETIFARIALADEITIRIGRRGRSLDAQGAELGEMERNLAWRAAVAFAERTGWPDGFAIEIHKRIPVGAGLGGGSADAGAVLRALNALAPSPIDEMGLLRLAVTLGADVPFLSTSLSLALAWGRGERLLAVPAPDARPVLLLIPPFSVATAEAFAWLAEARERDGSAGGDRPAAVIDAGGGDWSVLAALTGNDLEAPVRRRHPELGRVLDELRLQLGERAQWVAMTGSGSTLFVIGAAGRLPDVPPREGWTHIRTVAPADVAPVESLD